MAASLPPPSVQHTENFRSSNVRFLQEQNKQVLTALEKVEDERDEALQVIKSWEQRQRQAQVDYDKLQKDLDGLEQHSLVSRADLQKKDEQIRVLSEQNRQLLTMLEQEEVKAKEKNANYDELKEEHDKLSKVADEYDRVKANGDQQVLAANTEIAKMEEQMRGAQHETEQLQTAARNFASQAKIDIEALEESLADSKKKNVAHLQQIQHNEVNEHRLQTEIHGLKELIDELTVQHKGLKLQLDGDQAAREKWTKSRVEVTKRLENLETTAEELRRALKNAEVANEKMQGENRSGAEKFREMGDKVYALMDQLRLNQVELQKQEQLGKEKAKKIQVLDKQVQTLQGKLSLETDAKFVAEADARSAAQMQALLMKKHKKLNESLQLALRAQEKAEKRVQELTDKANALQTQNSYLASRVDGQEEDKGALKAELRKQQEDMRLATQAHQTLITRNTELDDELNGLEAEKAALNAELEYIKREDMLDETGRTKPILIESNDSKLVERLQVNEFLFSAQQARNPVPMLIEKISHILELLHTAQSQSDQYLQDLQRSNQMLTAMREKNMILYERTQMCETWKMRALLKIVSNAFELREQRPGHVAGRDGHSLFLDGLQYGSKELSELRKLIVAYDKRDNIHKIRLQDNGLADAALQDVLDLLDLCPYLQNLDLRKNRFSDEALLRLESHLRSVGGVTSVARDPGNNDLRAHSGNQLRLHVMLDGQMEGAADSTPYVTEITTDLSVTAADDFLQSSAGAMGGAMANATQAMPGGLGQTASPTAGTHADRQFGATAGGNLGGSGNTMMPTALMPLQQSQPPSGNNLGNAETVGKFGGVPVGLGGAGEVSKLGPRDALPKLQPGPKAGSGRPR